MSPARACSTSRTGKPIAPRTRSRASGSGFEPGYALGLAALKADRLFDPEHRLLYWSILRPGVLVGRRPLWFAAPPRRDRALRRTRRSDDRRARAGRRRRRPRAPALATALRSFRSSSRCRDLRDFFAEPRYRLPIQLSRSRSSRWRWARLSPPGARGDGTVARRPRARGEGARPGAGRRRRLALRLAGGCSTAERRCGRRHRWAVTRSPSTEPPLAAVGAGAAARGAVAARGVARGRARATAPTRDPRRCACVRRRSAAGRKVRASLSAGVGVRVPRALSLAERRWRPSAGCPAFDAEIDHPGGLFGARRRN